MRGAPFSFKGGKCTCVSNLSRGDPHHNNLDFTTKVLICYCSGGGGYSSTDTGDSACTSANTSTTTSPAPSLERFDQVRRRVNHSLNHSSYTFSEKILKNPKKSHKILKYPHKVFIEVESVADRFSRFVATQNFSW